MNKVRVRIAPSPTGFLHIGTLRAALFNWLFAKQNNGTFVLRIEDTDRERSKPEFEENILEGLAWLGLDFDEFARQTEHASIYKKYLQQLLDGGKAFYCNHEREELMEESDAQRTAKEAPRHICKHRDGSIASGIIRFKNDSKEKITVKDIIRGEVEYDASLLGDFSLARSLAEALYNFAVVVDDEEMNISHVIRGEDHLPNTPKQILIQKALDFGTPIYAHMPLLLGADRSKLSKRHGARAVTEYREMGYLKDAVINFVALLGWHPPAVKGEKEKEIFSLEELLKKFDLEKVQKGGAIVALEKLDWFNKEYLKFLPLETLTEEAKSFVTEPVEESLSKYMDVLRGRITHLTDLDPEIKNIRNISDYDSELLLWHGKLTTSQAAQNIDNIIEILSGLESSNFDQKSVESALTLLLEKDGKGAILWPLRASLSGQESSPGPFELAGVLGQKETIYRLKKAREILL
ncbi:MAG: glutamate--tRNA ligase [bacterium]|nr:glutamate--tRNA ligase [bacterium]